MHLEANSPCGTRAEGRTAPRFVVCSAFGVAERQDVVPFWLTGAFAGMREARALRPLCTCRQVARVARAQRSAQRSEVFLRCGVRPRKAGRVVLLALWGARQSAASARGDFLCTSRGFDTSRRVAGLSGNRPRARGGKKTLHVFAFRVFRTATAVRPGCRREAFTTPRSRRDRRIMFDAWLCA